MIGGVSMRVLVLESDNFQALYFSETIERVGGTVLGPYTQASQIPIAFSPLPDAAMLSVDDDHDLEVVIELALALLCEGCEVRLTTGYSKHRLPLALARVATMTKPVTREQIVAFMSARGSQRTGSPLRLPDTDVSGKIYPISHAGLESTRKRG